MTQENAGNRNIVYIVFNDRRKDFSKAEKFGDLKDVFSSVGRTFNGDIMVDHARSVLENYREGDYLLMVGDPALCAICVAVAAEYEAKVKILRWDREDYQYSPVTLDFGLI